MGSDLGMIKEYDKKEFRGGRLEKRAEGLRENLKRRRLQQREREKNECKDDGKRKD